MGPLMSTPLINTGQPTLYYFKTGQQIYIIYHPGARSQDLNTDPQTPGTEQISHGHNVTSA